MTVLIREIVSEVVLAPRRPNESGPAAAHAGQGIDDALVEAIVRRASARVLAELRLEWDR